MRGFLGVLIGILGIGAIASVLLGFGTQTMFWQIAHIVAGIVLIVGAVLLVRQPVAVVDSAGDDYRRL